LKVEKCSQDLENEVIYAGLCIHCGSCNAFCPHMDFNQETGEAYVVDECTETVGLCYNACPRSFLPVSEIEQALFGQTRADLAVGVYKDIIQVKSSNKDEILYNIVLAAFEKGIIKHLVVGKPKSKKPPVAFPEVVDSAKDAKSLIPKATMDNAGPLITGIGKAYLDKKRDIGVIGNPCHLQGLAKILVSDFNTGAERTSLKLGFASLDVLFDLLVSNPFFLVGFNFNQFHVYLIKHHSLAAFLIHNGIDGADQHEISPGLFTGVLGCFG